MFNLLIHNCSFEHLATSKLWLPCNSASKTESHSATGKGREERRCRLPELSPRSSQPFSRISSPRPATAIRPPVSGAIAEVGTPGLTHWIVGALARSNAWYPSPHRRLLKRPRRRRLAIPCSRVERQYEIIRGVIRKINT
ncbi:hypothetical protein DAI22_11g230500 [Oryza sativa Japonica Group]|nr:hypothetical protein DAI22_11g230500 [Oryza sativa Japonica Group]